MILSCQMMKMIPADNRTIIRCASSYVIFLLGNDLVKSQYEYAIKIVDI